jgi:hypothetical protein
MQLRGVMPCYWERCVFYLGRRSCVCLTVNTSHLYMGWFGSNFGRDTDSLDTMSIVSVSKFKKIVRLCIKLGYELFDRFPSQLPSCSRPVIRRCVIWTANSVVIVAANTQISSALTSGAWTLTDTTFIRKENLLHQVIDGYQSSSGWSNKV